MVTALQQPLEVVVGDDFDVSSTAALEDHVFRTISAENAIARGEARRVKKPPAAAGETKGDTAAPRHQTKLSKGVKGYGEWSSFDGDDSDDSDETFEIVEISEQEKEQNSRERQARVNAEAKRTAGNTAFKAGDFGRAVAEYTSGIRHAPSDALFSNRALAYWNMHELGECLRDCDLALRLNPAHVKSLVRRGDVHLRTHALDLAEADAAAAIAAAPKFPGALALRGRVEEARREAQRAARLQALAGGGGGAGGEGSELEDVREILGAIRAASAGEPAPQEEGLAKPLERVRRHLKASQLARDYFVVEGGLDALLSPPVYRENNLLVLATACDAVAGASEALGPETLARCSASSLAAVAGTILDRRVAVIGAGIELLRLGMRSQEFVKRAAELLLSPTEKYLETLVRMMEKASASLHQKKELVTVQAVRHALRPHAPGPLRGALVRSWGRAQDEGSRHAGLATALTVCKKDMTIAAALRAEPVVEGLLHVLTAEAETLPETGRRLHAGGTEVVRRDFAAYARDPDGPGAARALLALRVLEALLLGGADVGEFAHLVDAKDAWPALVPFLEAPGKYSTSAARSMVECARRLPSAAAALGELGAGLAAVGLTGGSPPSGGEPGGAALDLLSICVPTLGFQQEMRATAGFIKIASLLHSGASDHQVEVAAYALLHTLNRDPAALTWACTQPGLLRTLVDLWYGRRNRVKARVQGCIQKLLREDATLAAAEEVFESEERALGFAADLQAQGRLEAAYLSGGASLAPPPPGESSHDPDIINDEEAVSRMCGLAADRLGSYLSSLLPAGAGRPVLAEWGVDTGRLAVELAAHRELRSALVYAGCAGRARAAAVQARAKGAAAEIGGRVVAVLCEDGDLSVLPTSPHLILLAFAFDREPALSTASMRSLFSSAKAKLAPGGMLVVAEEDINVLDTATAAALQEGLEMYSSPGVLKDLYVRVLQCGGCNAAPRDGGTVAHKGRPRAQKNPFSRIPG